MLLPRTPERRPTPATSPSPIVVALRANDRGCLARAIALAAAGPRVLHLVVHTPQPPPPWVLLAGGGPWRASPPRMDDLAARLRACGVHVEVHRSTGRPRRLAQAIATTCGGDLVT